MTHPRFPPEERHGLLQVVPLHVPRGWAGPAEPWEIQRGFRLRVATPDVLVVTLGNPSPPGGRPPEAVVQHAPQAGEESLLVLPAPRGPDLAAFEEALALPGREGWRPACALVLSDRRQLQRPFAAHRRELSGRARRAGVPAAWVLQEMPEPLFRGLPYFTVEQTLRQLGRTGRRLARWAKWRRLLPW